MLAHPHGEPPGQFPQESHQEASGRLSAGNTREALGPVTFHFGSEFALDHFSDTRGAFLSKVGNGSTVGIKFQGFLQLESVCSAQKAVERMFGVLLFAKKGTWRLSFKATVPNPALSFDKECAVCCCCCHCSMTSLIMEIWG